MHSNATDRMRAVLANEKLLRTQFAQLAGLQYDKARNVYKVAGYPTEYKFAEGWSRYKRQGVAKRIVDLPVNKTWRHKPEIIDLAAGEGEETEFTKAWDELWDDFKLGARFSQVDRMASIGEFAILLLGFTDAKTDQDMARAVESPEGIAFVRGYKEKDVSIQEFETDRSNPRHGRPTLYQIDLGASNRGRKAQKLGTINVHWSRVIHVVEDPLDSDVFGLPRLQSCINSLIDYEKIKAGSAEATWQLAVRILHLSLPENADVDDSDLDDLEDDLLDLVQDLRRHWIAQGMDLNWLDGEAPNVESPAELAKVALAVDSGIPKRVLFGTETGERASEQDERALLGMVGERIEQYAEPTLVRGLTDMLIETGVLPEPRDGYALSWRPLFELNELQQAQVDKARAETAETLTPIGGNPLELAMIDENSRVRLKPSVEIKAAAEQDEEPGREEDGGQGEEAAVEDQDPENGP